MKIKDIVKEKIISVNSEDTIIETSKKMKEHNIGFIPVIEEDEFVGVITDRDITIHCVTNDDIHSKVKDYMQPSIVYIEEDKNIEDALELMGEEKIKRLLITRDEEVIGVLSLSDILHFASESCLLKTIKNIFHCSKEDVKEEAEIDEFYL